MTVDQESLDQMGEWVFKNRPAYEDAIKKLSDPAWVRNMLKVLKDQLDDILGYNALQHEPHVAVFAAGRAQARTEGLFADIELLDQWEEEKARYDEAVAEINAREDESPNPA